MTDPRLVSAPSRLWRIGRDDDVFNTGKTIPLDEWPEDERVDAGSRFDDPYGRFKTLYLAESRRGCAYEFAERFRRKPGLIEKIYSETDDDADAELDPRSPRVDSLPATLTGARWHQAS
jgi:hypothetical protein